MSGYNGLPDSSINILVPHDAPEASSGKNPISKYQFVYHFLPHPVHKRRARLLSPVSFASYCLVMLAFLALFKAIPTFAPGVLGYASHINVSDLFHKTNQERQSRGFSELRLNPKLSKAAEQKALHMFEKNYWAHISPDGTEPWDFILDTDYDYLYAGENLAKNFSSSNEVVVAWLNSPSHRDNLLSPNYDEIGFGVVNGVLNGYETTLVVQMFGRPRSAAQLASVNEEEKLLQSYREETVVSGASEIGMPAVPVSPSGPLLPRNTVLPFVDVSAAAKSVSISFAVFISLLLVLDIWYSSKKGILKLNGHTVSHLILLIVVIVGVWFVLKPGAIL
jgi:uncharacterized protein YkwD